MSPWPEAVCTPSNFRVSLLPRVHPAVRRCREIIAISRAVQVQRTSGSRFSTAFTIHNSFSQRGSDLRRRGRRPGSKVQTRKPRDKVAKSVSSRKSLRVFCDLKGKTRGRTCDDETEIPLAPAGKRDCSSDISTLCNDGARRRKGSVMTTLCNRVALGLMRDRRRHSVTLLAAGSSCR